MNWDGLSSGHLTAGVHNCMVFINRCLYALVAVCMTMPAGPSSLYLSGGWWMPQVSSSTTDSSSPCGVAALSAAPASVSPASLRSMLPSAALLVPDAPQLLLLSHWEFCAACKHELHKEQLPQAQDWPAQVMTSTMKLATTLYSLTCCPALAGDCCNLPVWG